MALITPRRRFLITAPLALLLPAGLLTYLGLETVRGVEMQYEQTAQEKVRDIVNRVRNRTTNRVNYSIQQPFRDIFVREGVKQIPEFPLPPGFTFQLSDSIPAAKLIFLYGSDRHIYFFHRLDRQREESQKPPPEEGESETSVWELSDDPRDAFSSRLKSAIDYDLESFQDTVQDVTPSYRLTSRRDFRALHYPDEYYPLEGQRILAFYTLLSPVPPSGRLAWIPAIGITIDFDYINREFFQSILDEMWVDMLHPIAIEDDLTRQWVARMVDPSEGGMRESTKYFPCMFQNEYFPWYRIHFSKEIGEEVMQIANYLKIFYYCLIAAANVIMIASVLGALRNISKELALSGLRSNFVARVSHELRTPLGLIRLYAETLEMNRAKTEEKRREYLHAITKESERLTHMINNILNFSRIEANKEQYSFSATSIEPVIMDTVETMRYHFERHGLSIGVSIDVDLPELRCDPEALQQALYNLLNNAMKYSGDGKEVWVHCHYQDNEIIIEVSDFGIGIAPDQQEKIFDEFYRVDDPRVQETGGSGLGLAVVKHIVQAHKGSIQVKSKPGEGSTFAIHLPISGTQMKNGKTV